MEFDKKYKLISITIKIRITNSIMIKKITNYAKKNIIQKNLLDLKKQFKIGMANLTN